MVDVDSLVLTPVLSYSQPLLIIVVILEIMKVLCYVDGITQKQHKVINSNTIKIVIACKRSLRIA
jgi:hypothetical protein